MLNVDFSSGDNLKNLSPYQFKPDFSKEPTWKKINDEEIKGNQTKEEFIIDRLIDALNSQVVTYNTPAFE